MYLLKYRAQNCSCIPLEEWWVYGRYSSVKEAEEIKNYVPSTICVSGRMFPLEFIIFEEPTKKDMLDNYEENRS